MASVQRRPNATNTNNLRTNTKLVIHMFLDFEMIPALADNSNGKHHSKLDDVHAPLKVNNSNNLHCYHIYIQIILLMRWCCRQMRVKSSHNDAQNPGENTVGFVCLCDSPKEFRMFALTGRVNCSSYNQIFVWNLESNDLFGSSPQQESKINVLCFRQYCMWMSSSAETMVVL